MVVRPTSQAGVSTYLVQRSELHLRWW